MEVCERGSKDREIVVGKRERNEKLLYTKDSLKYLQSMLVQIDS